MGVMGVVVSFEKPHDSKIPPPPGGYKPPGKEYDPHAGYDLIFATAFFMTLIGGGGLVLWVIWSV